MKLRYLLLKNEFQVFIEGSMVSEQYSDPNGYTFKHWHRLPRVGMDSPSLEVFRSCGDVALRDVVVMGQQLDLMILLVFSNLNDSMLIGRN